MLWFYFVLRVRIEHWYDCAKWVTDNEDSIQIWRKANFNSVVYSICFSCIYLCWMIESIYNFHFRWLLRIQCHLYFWSVSVDFIMSWILLAYYFMEKVLNVLTEGIMFREFWKLNVNICWPEPRRKGRRYFA